MSPILTAPLQLRTTYPVQRSVAQSSLESLAVMVADTPLTAWELWRTNEGTATLMQGEADAHDHVVPVALFAGRIIEARNDQPTEKRQWSYQRLSRLSLETAKTGASPACTACAQADTSSQGQNG